MIKPFFVQLSFLSLLLFSLILHYLLTPVKKTEEALALVTQLSGISAPSLSVNYYEPRLRLYEKAVNPAYPQMQALDSMDFIYAK